MCLGVASELHHKPREINLKGEDQFFPVMLPLWPSHPALRSRDPSGVKSPPGTAPVPLGAVPRTGRDPQTPVAVPGVCLCLGGCARDTESQGKGGGRERLLRGNKARLRCGLGRDCRERWPLAPFCPERWEQSCQDLEAIQSNTPEIPPESRDGVAGPFVPV